jgi:hypothetical protein
MWRLLPTPRKGFKAAAARGAEMAIYRIFKERPFDPETIVRLSAAYECALRALRLVDRQDPLTELVARKIIDVAETGEADPDRLGDRALEELGISPPSAPQRHAFKRARPSRARL